MNFRAGLVVTGTWEMGAVLNQPLGESATGKYWEQLLTDDLGGVRATNVRQVTAGSSVMLAQALAQLIISPFAVAVSRQQLRHR